MDYAEQTSWLLFLKYLDGLEQDRADEAALGGKSYSYILDAPYRWDTWAAPKGRDGKPDHHAALTGDDLRDFVNLKLFPYLHGFTQRATGPDTIEYKIGQIFGEIKNKISSGYNLREIIDHIDQKGYRFFFFSREEPRLHVHVVSGDGEAKFWLGPEIQLEKSHRYNRQQLKEIESLIEDHYHELVSAWKNYFGG